MVGPSWRLELAFWDMMGFSLGAGIAGGRGHLPEVVPEESMGVSREADRLFRLWGSRWAMSPLGVKGFGSSFFADAIGIGL